MFYASGVSKHWRPLSSAVCDAHHLWWHRKTKSTQTWVSAWVSRQRVRLCNLELADDPSSHWVTTSGKCTHRLVSCGSSSSYSCPPWNWGCSLFILLPDPLMWLFFSVSTRDKASSPPVHFRDWRDGRKWTVMIKSCAFSWRCEVLTSFGVCTGGVVKSPPFLKNVSVLMLALKSTIVRRCFSKLFFLEHVSHDINIENNL